MNELTSFDSISDIASNTFCQAFDLVLGLSSKPRYYLMRQTCREENKTLLKFVSFDSKAQFKEWTDICRRMRLIEWQAGFLFKLYDDEYHYILVDKHGKEPKRSIE